MEEALNTINSTKEKQKKTHSNFEEKEKFYLIFKYAKFRIWVSFTH